MGPTEREWETGNHDPVTWSGIEPDLVSCGNRPGDSELPSDIKVTGGRCEILNWLLWWQMFNPLNYHRSDCGCKYFASRSKLQDSITQKICRSYGSGYIGLRRLILFVYTERANGGVILLENGICKQTPRKSKWKPTIWFLFQNYVKTIRDFRPTYGDIDFVSPTILRGQICAYLW